MLIFSLIVIQLIFFGGLILILRNVLTKNVVQATRHIDEMNQQYARKEVEINQKLEEVQKNAEETLSKAQQEAENKKSQILKEAEEERNKILEEARAKSEELIQQADRSRQLLLAEINERIAREAVDKACELIECALPQEFKLDVHRHWIDELMDGVFSQFERLKISDDIHEAKIISAFPLTEEDRKKLSKKLREALGREITCQEEVDPRIVAGFSIHIGSLVLDGSLRNKIQEKARNV